jgi:phosphoglycerate dehydrogenase-like enzyme
MLTVLKKIRERDEQVKRGGWRREDLQGIHLGARQDGYPGITIGIVGLGRIGARVAEMLRPWRVRIIAYDPYVPKDRFALVGVESVDYEALLRESDVVSFHVVLTKETRHMLGAAQLALMKPTSVLVNTSRGGVVDEAALAEALERGTIASAAVDVFEDEPLPAESPLRELGSRVLLAPHMASSNYGSGLGPGITWATESVLKALRGEVPDNVYNKDVIPRWLQRFRGTTVN